MKLSTRLTLAMVALVVLTAAAVGALTYRNIEAAVVPRALDRLGLEARLLAGGLTSEVSAARSDVLGFRAAVALNGIIRASRAGGVDPVDRTTLDEWRRRMAQRYAVELSVNPLHVQYRIIGAAGREIVRVDRSGTNGAVRVVPDAELQQKVDRDYFRRTIDMPDGEVYVSPVDLNVERGKIEVPHVPVLRVGTPVYDANGQPFGVFIINVDMRPAFDRIRLAVQAPVRVFVVNDQGDYLVNPDRGREFGFQLGHRFQVKDDFPGLAQGVSDGKRKSTIVTDRGGTRYAAALATVVLAGGTRVTVIDTVPYAEILESFGAVRNASLLAGLAAVLLAIALAIILSRSLTRPLARMTAAVEGFGRGETLEVPTEAGGEIGSLARAFRRMANDVTEKTATIRRNAEIFDTVMGGMTSGVLLIDETMENVYANAAARSILGPLVDSDWRAWQAQQKMFHADGVTPVAPDERPRVRAVRGENVDNMEMALQFDWQDAPVHLIVTARPIHDENGKPKGAVMVFRDITKIRETERQLRQSQKMDAIGQLTGGVAHDFNNLLTVIIGSIEVLADELADAARSSRPWSRRSTTPRRAAPTSRASCSPSRGASRCSRALTDVNALVVEAVDAAAADARRASRHRIGAGRRCLARHGRSDPARDAHGQSRGQRARRHARGRQADDRDRQRRARRQPTPPTTPTCSPATYVMIAVSDTGTGMPEAIRDKVFEPFFTTKEVGKGTGLGLSMVYGFIKQSRGHVKVYSEDGHGTTIKLYLPRADARTAKRRPSRERARRCRSATRRILVVEDDDLVRDSRRCAAPEPRLPHARRARRRGRAGAGRRGRQIRSAVHRRDHAGRHERPELADELARRWPGLRVLFTSGYTEDAIVHHGRLDAGVALLNKPYRKADLARKVREVLSAPSPPH